LKFSLTIPQLFYDFIARVFPGFLFLLVLRACLAGTGLAPSSVAFLKPSTSIEVLLGGLGFLVICYFAGWFLRCIRWPNLQPEETSEFRTMYQRIRLQHPESGFRIVKLRAEARFLEASRVGMLVVCIVVLMAWAFRATDLVAGDSIPQSVWALRLGLPLLVGLAFLSRERGMWGVYRGNVKKLHSLIIDEGYPRQNDLGPEVAVVPKSGA